MKQPRIVLLVCIISCHVAADDAGMQKYKNYTPEQIQKLPKSVLDSDLPIAYHMAANMGLSKGSELAFASELNSLMYAGVHDFDAAVKSFQKDLGDEPTGVLTVWQIHNLEKRAGMQKLADVLFPDEFSSWISKDYASVVGTMMIHDEKIAWPVNHSELTCYRKSNYCEFKQLYVIFPNDDSWGQNFQVMTSDVQYYDIVRWSQNTIDAVPSSPGNTCRVTEFNLNFKTKEFYQITRNGENECDISGAKLPKLSKPRVSQIVDGKDIIKSEFRKIQQAAYSVLSSDFKKRVEMLQSTSKKE